MTGKPLKGVDRTVRAHIDKTGAVQLTITEGPPDAKKPPVLLRGTIRTDNMDVVAAVIAAAISAPEGGKGVKP